MAALQLLTTCRSAAGILTPHLARNNLTEMFVFTGTVLSPMPSAQADDPRQKMAVRALDMRQVKLSEETTILGCAPIRATEETNGKTLLQKLIHDVPDLFDNIILSTAQAPSAEPKLVDTSTTAQFQTSPYGKKSLLSRPNPKPEHVSDRFHNIICKSVFVQNVLYGVQDPQVGPSIWERVKGVFNSKGGFQVVEKDEAGSKESDENNEDVKESCAKETHVREEAAPGAKAQEVTPSSQNKKSKKVKDVPDEVPGFARVPGYAVFH